MASIRELFADPELNEEGGEEQIDLNKVLDEVTNVLNDRTPPPERESSTPEDEAPSDPDQSAAADEEGDGEEEEEPEAPESVPAASVPPSDPLAEPERRAALLALDQTLMSDESKRAEVFRILSGEPRVQAPPPPTLPEHIDPDSFEATIWKEQQATNARIAEISEHTRLQQEAFEKQRANAAAMEAGNRFAQKYAGKLDQNDILEIAKYAGTTGIAGTFTATKEGRENPTEALERALEHTLWTNESFRAKILGTDGPTTPPGEQPAAQERKRKLTAVSSSASPVTGSSSTRSPLENDSNGRLQEKSRMQVVQDLATGLARESRAG